MSAPVWLLIADRLTRRCEPCRVLPVHQGDQLAAYVRDFLDEVGADVHDPAVVHGVATGLCLGESAIASAHAAGQVSPLTYGEVVDYLLTGLVPFMPGEVAR